MDCGKKCTRREFFGRVAAGAGTMGISGALFPGLLFAAGKADLKVNVTGRCVFNGIVVTNEKQEGLPNPYKNETPFNFTMNDDCSGLEKGIDAVKAGKADIGTLLRPLTEKEKGMGLMETTLDRMAYAVVVNKKNSVKGLSRTQVLEIFAGKIKNWKEVGGPDAEILLYKQECGASYDSVLDKEIAGAGIKKDAERLDEAVMFVEVTDNQLEKIAENESAVALVPRMFFDDNSKFLAIDGILPSRETERNGSYPLLAHRALVTKRERSANVDKFLAFVTGDHGKELMEKGYAMDWLSSGF